MQPCRMLNCEHPGCLGFYRSLLWLLQQITTSRVIWKKKKHFGKTETDSLSFGSFESSQGKLSWCSVCACTEPSLFLPCLSRKAPTILTSFWLRVTSVMPHPFLHGSSHLLCFCLKPLSLCKKVRLWTEGLSQSNIAAPELDHISKDPISR